MRIHQDDASDQSVMVSVGRGGTHQQGTDQNDTTKEQCGDEISI